MPKVSVIIPVYNCERYISRCVDSVLGQTFGDFELILVDDGSKDGSGKICDEYVCSDDRVKVIHKQNAGVSAARNTGIDNATGEYMMFVDGDDYIDPEMLEAMIDKMQDADLVISGLRYVDTEGKNIKEYNSVYTGLIDRKAFINHLYNELKNNYLLAGVCNKLYKSSIVNSKNIKCDETASILEDGMFVAQYLLQCETILCIEHCFYNYVQYNGGSLMSRYNDNAIEMAEKMHLIECGLIEDATQENKEALLRQIEGDTINHMACFYSYIYSRSSFNLHGKCMKARYALRNPVFRKLLNNSDSSRGKIKLLKLAAENKFWFYITHILFAMRYAFRG